MQTVTDTAVSKPAKSFQLIKFLILQPTPEKPQSRNTLYEEKSNAEFTYLLDTLFGSQNLDFLTLNHGKTRSIC